MANLVQNLLFNLKANSKEGVAEINKFFESLKKGDADSKKTFSRLAKGLEDVAKGNVGIESVTSGLKSLAGEGTTAGIVTGGVTAAFVAGAVAAKELADRTAEVAKQQNNLVQIGGLYREQAAAVQFAGKQIGLSYEQQLQIANKLNLAVQNSTEDQRAAFRNLKIDLDKIPQSGRNAGAVFEQVVKGTKDLKDAGQRAAVLTTIFGDDLQGKFQEVAGKIDGATKKVKELGLVFSAQKQEELAQYRETMAGVTAELEAMGIKIGSTVAPAITGLIQTAKGLDLGKIAYGFSNPIAGAANFGKTLGELWGQYERLNDQAAFDARVKEKQAQQTRNLKAEVDALTKSYNEQTQALQTQQAQINTRQGSRLAGIKATSSDDELVITDRKNAAIRELEKQFYQFRSIDQKTFEAERLKIDQKAEDDLLKSKLTAAKRTAASDKTANEELVKNAEARVLAIQMAHQKAVQTGDTQLIQKLDKDLEQAHIAVEQARTRATEQGATDRKAVADLEEQQKTTAHQREIDRIQREEAARKQATESQIKDNARRKAADDLNYSQRLEALMQSGLTQKQAEEELSFLKIQNLKREIDGIGLLILSKSSEKDSEAEVLDLKKQRLALLGQIRDAETAAGAAAEEANRKAAASAKELSDAAAAGLAARNAAIAALYDSYRAGIQQAASATAENIDEILAQAEKRFFDFNHAVMNHWEAGLFGPLKDLANQAWQEILQKRQKLFEDQREKEREDQRKANEQARSEATSAYESYTKDRDRLNQESADRERKINEELASLPSERDAEELASRTRLETDLAKKDAERLERQKRTAEEAARAQIRAAEDALTEIARKKLQADLDANSSQGSLFDESLRLQTDLQNAKTPEEKAKIQAQLDDLSKKRERAAAHDREVQAAIAKGASDDEIKRLNDLFTANEEFLARKQAASALTNEAERNSAIAAAQAILTERTRLIEAQAATERKAAETKAAREKEDRERAAAEEKAAYDKEKSDLAERNRQEIESIRSKYADKEKALQANLTAEKAAHDKALADLETRTAEAFSKMSAAAQAYFNQLKQGFASIPGGTPGGGGSPTGGTPTPTTTEGGNTRTTTPPTPPPSPTPAPQPAGNQTSTPGGNTGPTPKPTDPNHGLNFAEIRKQEEELYNGTLKYASEAVLGGNTASAVEYVKILIQGISRQIASNPIKKIPEAVAIGNEYIKKYQELLTGLETGTFAPTAKNTDTTTGPDKTASTGPTTVTGPKPKNTDTTTGPGFDKTASTGPTTVRDSSQPPPKRDPNKAAALDFAADTFRTEEEAKKLVADTKAAKAAGLIDEDDERRIKAHADKHGFDIGIAPPFAAATAQKTNERQQAAAAGLAGAVKPASPAAPPSSSSAPTSKPVAPSGPGTPLVAIGQITGTKKSEILDEIDKALDKAGF